MIKINDILNAETNSINAGLKAHYFKDITFHGVAELVERENSLGESIERPAIYDGKGDYTFIQDDTKGLIVYHRIVGEVSNDEDLSAGFGRNSLTTLTYTIKSVFYGQQAAIEVDCEDINFYLATEFKKLVPRSLTLDDINRITVTGINYDKNAISEEEKIDFVPESVLFTLDLSIVIKTTENCNTLTCN